MFSPSATLLAGVWSIWRESQFAVGKVDRSVTEAISSAVSRLNTCPYCVDTHSGMLHALSEHKVVLALRQNNNDLIQDDKLRRIVEWSQATRDPDAEIISSPPFSHEEAPEIIGTTIVYHFINRMANIFLEPSPLPVPNNWNRTKNIALRVFGATVAKRIVNRKPKPGESLQFIHQSTLPPDLAWAGYNDDISAAFAAFSSMIEKSGQEALTEAGRSLIQQRIQSWQGEDMGLSKVWANDILENFTDEDKSAGELALLTALAPHQINKNIISQFRSVHPSDEALLNITAWASFSAARRIGEWLKY
ncbi:MAG: carboxymuconolactone decarboxylase family protein [Methylococcales bacterium]